MQSSNYKYKFSVIIPVYKVENYVAESIESVINQTIGFNENIQIILVNDGSPDNSEKICKKYQKKYPKNIIYIYQENNGVSSARNNGLNYVEGKYINFLDSDDVWQDDVFEKAWNMFEENDDVDVIGVRQKFFEAANGYPSLDFKFNADKVVDIREDYDHIQLSVTSGFFRTSAIGSARYDTRIKYSEDAKFINEVILKNCKLGIISSSLHMYRKRASENSAIQTKNFKDDWYLITTELCYLDAIKLSKKLFGTVIPYVQYYIAYDYQWRLREAIPFSVSEEVIKKYKIITKKIFDQLNDKIIFEQNRLTADLKIEYLKIKYGENVTDKFVYNKRRKSIYYKDLYTYNLEKNHFVHLKMMNVDNEFVTLKGIVNLNLPTSLYNINVVLNNKKRIKLDLKETSLYEKRTLDYVFMSSKGYEVKIPLEDLKSMHFEFVFKNEYKLKIKFMDNIYTHLSPRTKIYYRKSGKIFYYIDKQIRLKNDTLKNRVHFKLRNLKYNLKNKEYGVIFDRFVYGGLKKVYRKEIWLVSDRPDTANDNGYALFKHMQDHMPKKTAIYFVINKSSNDFEKVKKTGKYIIYNSFKYKIYFLLSTKIISSQADGWVTNPFGARARFYQDLMDSKFYFLQHGITQNDLSVWLNHYEKKLELFVTSTVPEYESIINGNYGFGKDVVKLTGLPRYDLLNDRKQKLIVIMPTWRTNLSTGININTGKRMYNKNFKQSEYYKFYNQLINDTKLIKLLKSKKYKCKFIMHPGHIANIDDFKTNRSIEIVKGNINYSEIFSKASLLITDYSSVAFDFAYLRKPVIYTQFDKESFYENQIYTKGYFSYEKDGLGPVLYDYNKTINTIIKYVENNCNLESKYEKRINKFYKYSDKNNSSRVYENILK